MNQLALLEEIAECALKYRAAVNKPIPEAMLCKRIRARLDRFLAIYEERKADSAINTLTTEDKS